VTSGAQSPTTNDASSEGREKEATLPRVVEFDPWSRMAEAGGQRPPPTTARIIVHVLDMLGHDSQCRARERQMDTTK